MLSLTVSMTGGLPTGLKAEGSANDLLKIHFTG